MSELDRQRRGCVAAVLIFAANSIALFVADWFAMACFNLFLTIMFCIALATIKARHVELESEKGTPYYDGKDTAVDPICPVCQEEFDTIGRCDCDRKILTTHR